MANGFFPSLIKLRNFYSGILGLHHTCSYAGAHFFAADSYHHHIASDIWLGNNIANTDSRQLGLAHFSLNLESKENFEQLLQQIRRMKIKVLSNDNNKINNESFFIYDPDRIKIHVYYSQ